MASIHSLSNELLDMVLSKLKNKDVLAVITTCTSLKRNAERCLYSRVKLVVPKPERHDATKVLPVHRFFMTLSQRPELAEMVRSLRLIGVGMFSSRQHTCALPCDEAVLEAWLTAAERVGVTSIKPSTRQLIETGNPSVFVAILLAMCTELTSLTLHLSLLWEPELLAAVLVSRGGNSKLKEARIKNDRDSEGVREGCHEIPLWNLIQAFAHSPQLETLQVVLPAHESFSFDETMPVIQFPRVKSLTISDFGVNKKNVKSLLRCFPALTQIDYFLAMNYDDVICEERDSKVHDDGWRKLQDALEVKKDSLTLLFISVDFTYTDDYPPDDLDAEYMDATWERMGSMSCKAFHRLQKLQIPVIALLSAHRSQVKHDLSELIPQSLRRLILRDDCIWDTGVNGQSWVVPVHPQGESMARRHRLGTYYLAGALVTILEEFLTSHVGCDSYRLNSLCLRVLLRRIWSEANLERLRAASSRAGILCTIREMPGSAGIGTLKGKYREVIIHQGSGKQLIKLKGNLMYESKFAMRYVKEPRKIFEYNC